MSSVLGQDPVGLGGARLTIEQLGHLRMAGRWGLLRPQSGRRFMLTGQFSMVGTDLTRLIEAAGGRVELGADLRGGVDVLLAGEDANMDAVLLARDQFVEVWEEADLVLALVPSLESLTASPGEPPF